MESNYQGVSNSTLKKVTQRAGGFFVANAFLIVLFALAYWLISKQTKGAFNKKLEQKLSFSEALYFSTATHTTLGYGDILPTNAASRATASIQALLMFSLTTAFIVA